MKEQKKSEVEWDKKKIIIFLAAVLFLLIGIYELKSIILPENSNPKTSQNLYKNAKGINIQEPLQQSLKNNLTEQINNLRDEAQNINVVDIASSSPQVQKIINDLKALQNYPSNQAKQFCEKVCSGL